MPNKIIRIGFLGCPGCLRIDQIVLKLQKNYEIEVEFLDVDDDDISSYEVNEILPVTYINGVRLEGELNEKEITDHLV